MASLDNLAKSIEKLADAATELHQQNRQQSAKEKANAIFSVMTSKYLNDLQKMICADAAEVESSQYIKWRAAVEKYLNETSFPLPAPPQGNAEIDGVWRCGAYATSDICVNALIKKLREAQWVLKQGDTDGLHHQMWQEIQNVLSGWRFEGIE